MTARLPFTGNDEADALLVRATRSRCSSASRSTSRSPSRRPSRDRWSCGAGSATSTRARIAATDPAELDRVFRERPALHRFPGSMAGKVQALARGDRRALRRRRVADLARGEGRQGPPGAAARPARDRRDEGRGRSSRSSASGSASRLPGHGRRACRSTRPSATSTRAEALASYQAGKRAYKAELRAQGKRGLGEPTRLRAALAAVR